MSAVADDLRAARALVEKGWTQGAYGRLESGENTFAWDANVVCWCPVGAIQKATIERDRDDDQALDAFAAALVEYDKDAGPEGWNDAPGRTQAEVLAAFDRAIELAEAS